jgi:hypothetical protein
MRPFFTYFGGKHKLAPEYGEPKCDHVIEPFAGSAGYSTYWEPKYVTLIERDPVIVSMWRYLIGASKRDIKRLPSLVMDVDDLPPWVCQEARWLIRYWLDHGQSHPNRRLCNHARSLPSDRKHYWGEKIQRRIINQLEGIRHWTIIHGSYEDAPDIEAHYYIDPPYNNDAGQNYRFHHIHYGALLRWSVSRKGFVQICENDGAPWLPSPLRPVAGLTGHYGCSVECVYEQDNRGRQF